MEQKQLYENHYKDCAVSSHMELTPKNVLQDKKNWGVGWKKTKDRFKDRAVTSVCIVMTRR